MLAPVVLDYVALSKDLLSIRDAEDHYLMQTSVKAARKRGINKPTMEFDVFCDIHTLLFLRPEAQSNSCPSLVTIHLRYATESEFARKPPAHDMGAQSCKTKWTSSRPSVDRFIGEAGSFGACDFIDVWLINYLIDVMFIDHLRTME